MNQPRILWQPDPDARSQMAEFREWVAATQGVEVPDYAALWRWSVTDLEGFWGAFAQFAGVRWHTEPERVLAEAVMPGARWFPDATLNYAEHALAVAPGKEDADPAVIHRREDGRTEHVSFGQLRQGVG
ncbi:MAG: acetyl-coenzyme A synthetase N-terminal domain-containing protein, partial [Pseudonocardiaceae bacterium]